MLGMPGNKVIFSAILNPVTNYRTNNIITEKSFSLSCTRSKENLNSVFSC